MHEQNELVLLRFNDIVVPKALLAIDRFNINTVLAMIYSDGSVDFRDRTTLNILEPDDDDNKISSLHQIGFNFTGGRSCKSRLHVLPMLFATFDR